MQITWWKGVFAVNHVPAEAKLLEKHGFELHEPSMCAEPSACKACRAGIGRRYWSAKVEHATPLRHYCNARALAVLKDHLDRLRASNAKDSDILVPAPRGLTYKPYQKAGVAYAVKRKDVLFGDDMGLGKTVEALGLANYLHPRKILIICPATLTLNWKLEAKRWLVDNYRFYLPKKTSEPVPDFDDTERVVTIVNYEKTVGRTHKDKDDKGKEVRKHKHTPLSRSLLRSWDLCIVDEAQALKNPDTWRSRIVLGEGGIYSRSRRAAFLSGTPMENRPIEIWPLAAALCPTKFGDWWKFARRFCGLHQEQRGKSQVWVANGSTNSSELQQMLRTTFMIRRLKCDVMKELPPKMRQLIVLPSDNVDWDLYPSLQKWRELHEREFASNLALLESAQTKDEYERAVRELDKISIPFTETSDVRHKTALLKLPMCLKYADEVLASGLDALVIYAHHKDVLAKIHEHYGDQSCVIYGDTPQDQRIPIVQAFQSGQKRVFIGGLKAAGVGITLTRASTLMFFESDWNPATMSQAEDRLCRYGQTKMVNVIHPVLDHSIDANMVKMTVAKQNVVNKILNPLSTVERLQQAS